MHLELGGGGRMRVYVDVKRPSLKIACEKKSSNLRNSHITRKHESWIQRGRL